MAYKATSNTALGNYFSQPLSSIWILDSRATDHIVCNFTLFDSCFPVLDLFVQLPNQLTLTLTHRGTIQLSPEIILKDVLCVPSFKFNLVSMGKLT